MCNKAVEGISYERYTNVKPDLHYVRTFGSKTYAYIPEGPNKPREHDNSKIGYILGLDDDHIGHEVSRGTNVQVGTRFGYR